MTTAVQRLIFDAISEEREAQIAKWGVQSHPSVDMVLLGRIDGCTPFRMAEEYEIPTADRARVACEIAFEQGQGTWFHILTEEICEAVEAAVLYGEDSKEFREELIQSTAVLVAMLEDLDQMGDGCD